MKMDLRPPSDICGSDQDSRRYWHVQWWSSYTKSHYITESSKSVDCVSWLKGQLWLSLWGYQRRPVQCIKVFDMNAVPTGGRSDATGGNTLAYGLRNEVGLAFYPNNMLLTLLKP